MTDRDLRENLAALRAPASSPQARERALHRATLALDSASSAKPASAPARSAASLRHILAALGGAVATLALGFWLARPAPTANTPASLADRRTEALRLLAEVRAVFPDRLDAVIDRDGALHLALSDHASRLASDQAVLIELARAGRVVRVLGFSGRAVEMDLDGRRVSFSPLLTGEGGVLLAGSDFAWTDRQPAPAALAGWSIAALPL